MDKHNYSAPVSLKNIQVTDTFWKGGNGTRTQGGDPVSVGCLK